MNLLDQTDHHPEYNSRLEQAGAFILNQDDFLVVSHVNPDGDAIGSTLAVGHMLRQLGKRYVMVNEGATPGKFGLLPDSGAILDYSAADPAVSPPDFACVIAVDCADYERIGQVRNWFPESVPILNIDHHPTNDNFGTVNVVRPSAAATAEVLYDLGEKLGLSWELQAATCIYTGLLTDTGGFRYSNTTPKVLTIASSMLNSGVNGNELADHFLEKMTFAQVSVLRKALSALSFTPDRRIAWMCISQQDIRDAGADNGDLDGLVNYARNIEGVEVGLLFKESAEQVYKISLRSAGLADVSAVAQRFGGGGHVRAAGCTVKGTLEEAVRQVVEEAGRSFE